MRLLIQRVSKANVVVQFSTVGSISTGLLVFIGISREDTTEDADYLIDKLAGLRIFPDAEGKMNLNVQQAGGGLLLISQFTLYADCRRGRRPSFDRAASPAEARILYDYFVGQARKLPIRIETGVFQETMTVELVNEGPVTIWLESETGRR